MGKNQIVELWILESLFPEQAVFCAWRMVKLKGEALVFLVGKNAEYPHFRNNRLLSSQTTRYHVNCLTMSYKILTKYS